MIKQGRNLKKRRKDRDCDRRTYHLTDKAYLLPPNMRSIARFMNLNSWVDWGNKMLECFDNLPKAMQEAYSFILDYKEHEAKLNGFYESRNISSDIIESTFGIFKTKKSPNKLYGITPFVLFIPLCAKLENKSATKSFNFKER